MTHESFLKSYRELKRDMEGLPNGSSLRVKVKKQKSDLIQVMHEEVRNGRMTLPEGFNTVNKLPDDLKYLAVDFKNYVAPKKCETCGQIIKDEKQHWDQLTVKKEELVRSLKYR